MMKSAFYWSGKKTKKEDRDKKMTCDFYWSGKHTKKEDRDKMMKSVFFYWSGKKTKKEDRDKKKWRLLFIGQEKRLRKETEIKIWHVLFISQEKRLRKKTEKKNVLFIGAACIFAFWKSHQWRKQRHNAKHKSESWYLKQNRVLISVIAAGYDVWRIRNDMHDGISYVHVIYDYDENRYSVFVKEIWSDFSYFCQHLKPNVNTVSK